MPPRPFCATVGVQLTPEQFIDISLRQGQSTFKLAAEQGIPRDHRLPSGRA